MTSSATPAPSSYTVESVRTAMDLLFKVCKRPDVGVSDLARESGLGKARAYRLLRTLEECGLLQRTDNQRFRLGYAALLVGSAATSQIDLARLAMTELARVGAAVEETTQLRIRDGDESVCINRWEPSRDLRVHAAIGRRRRLGLGSNKSLLAFEPDEEIERTLDRLYAEPGMPWPRPKLREALAKVRREGYCVSYGEVSEDLISISVPVYAQGGKLVAAMNISAPAMRMSEERIRMGAEQLRQGAARLSAMLGWVNPPDRPE